MATAPAGAWLYPGRHTRTLHVYLHSALWIVLAQPSRRNRHVHIGRTKSVPAAAAGCADSWWCEGHAHGLWPPTLVLAESFSGSSAHSFRRDAESGDGMEPTGKDHSADRRNRRGAVL